MRKLLFCILGLVSFSLQASPNMWTSAVPREIHLVPHGLVLVGDFNLYEDTCTSRFNAIFLSGQDPMFKEKLTLALTAKASQKRIKAVFQEPRNISCIELPELGYVPMVSPYFWQLVD